MPRSPHKGGKSHNSSNILGLQNPQCQDWENQSGTAIRDTDVCQNIKGPIYTISYDNLTIMPKLRSSYNGRLIYQTSYEECKAFLGTIYLQNRKIVRDSVRKLA